MSFFSSVWGWPLKEEEVVVEALIEKEEEVEVKHTLTRQPYIVINVINLGIFATKIDDEEEML